MFGFVSFSNPECKRLKNQDFVQESLQWFNTKSLPLGVRNRNAVHVDMSH